MGREGLLLELTAWERSASLPRGVQVDSLGNPPPPPALRVPPPCPAAAAAPFVSPVSPPPTGLLPPTSPCLSDARGWLSADCTHRGCPRPLLSSGV